MTLWCVASATLLGRDHAVLRKNRQDAAAAGAFDHVAFGVVSDGCGQAAGSELGAQLTVAIAGSMLERALCDGVPLRGLGARVLDSVVVALREVAALLPAGVTRETFIRDHLLATIVGFAVDGDDACVFAVGDGSFCVDGALEVLDRDNRPFYPAYALVGGDVDLTERLVLVESRIAVATDGLDGATLRAVASIDAPSSSRLSRALAKAQRHGPLADDGAIAVANRNTGASRCA